nr:hypothetical protein [Tanacetum cinerariifolium]
MMRQNKNLMDINIDALYHILKQNQGDKKIVVVTSDPLTLIAEKTNVSRSKEKSANKKQEFVKSDDKKVEKKADEKKRDMSRVKCYNCKKEGHFAKDCKKAKVKDNEYYKTNMLLAKKDKDEQVLLAEDQAWMESSRGYSQWVERFMNYLEEQTDGEAMINSIKNGDQPLPRVTQVSIVGTSSTEQPPLKDKSMWSDQEKRIQKIDRIARSLPIQGLSNDIYSLIDSNKTSKDLWDALARHMLGSEYGEQDRKAVVLVKCYNCKKEGHFAKDCKKVKVKDYEYYKTKMLLAKKDKDKQVLLAEDQAWMESSCDSDQEINANMVFMAQIKKVLSDSEASSSSADEKISE